MPLQGRRLPDGSSPNDLTEPGDYFLTISKGAVWVRLPHPPPGAGPERSIGHLPVREDETGWKLTEHEDGTITLHPSIHDTEQGGYHGWLRQGVWTDG